MLGRPPKPCGEFGCEVYGGGSVTVTDGGGAGYRSRSYDMDRSGWWLAYDEDRSRE